MRQRWPALLLALVVLASAATGCARGGEHGDTPQAPTVGDSGAVAEKSAQAVKNQFKIAYNSGDSLDPYQAQSAMNRSVLPLLYDPLVKLDRTYTAHPIVAEEVRLEGITCTVTLRPGLVFSDGTPVMAADVLYSANLARTTGGAYAGLLDNVTEITTTDDGAVVFTLAQPDRLFGNLLTFPIVKEKEPTIGSGRYLLRGAGEQLRLESNPRWYGGDLGIQTIGLIHQLDKDTLIYSLKLGTINYAYSDPSGDETLSLGVSTQEVPLNQLVYLGINHTKSLLSSADFRRAVELGLSRQNLASQTYGNRAIPAYLPFHPLAAQLTGPDGVEPRVQNLQEARALLAGLGYETRDSEGYYVTAQGRLRLRLLVNVENEGRMRAAQLIQRELGDLGIEVQIDARMFEDYRRALETWDFDLYLGTVKIKENMDITFLLSPKGTAGFGLVEYEELLAANEGLKAGTVEQAAFEEVFGQVVPLIPLMYRSAIVSFSRDTYYDAQATEQDIFYNIQNW